MQKKKLIEVALPLEAINKASAREKSIRHGHSSTLHLWWARRPLAAARAVIFAQMVDDPSAHPEQFPTEAAQERERQRLFRLIEQLVQWENTTNEDVLAQARDELWKSWRSTCADNRDHPRAAELFNPDRLPAFHDPFAGGGSLPLEAQRLGLESYASDLNPVAVLICKAMIEIPPKFAGQPPVNPEARGGGVFIQRAGPELAGDRPPGARSEPRRRDAARAAHLTGRQEYGYTAGMKTTIDIPEDLYRKVKARSALEGRPVREVAIELFRQWVGESPAPGDGQPFVSVGELMADVCGMFDSGVTDLATNPAYLGDLGRDSLGDR